MLRGVWQALNCLFIHAVFFVIATTTDRHEASRGLFATAELLVYPILAKLGTQDPCASMHKTLEQIFEIDLQFFCRIFLILYTWT